MSKLLVREWGKDFCTVILEQVSKYFGSDQDVLKEPQEKYWIVEFWISNALNTFEHLGFNIYRYCILIFTEA